MLRQLVDLGNDTTSICQGDSVLLDAGAGHTNYLWSTGETTQTIYADASGSYSVTVGNGTPSKVTAIAWVLMGRMITLKFQIQSKWYGTNSFTVSTRFTHYIVLQNGNDSEPYSYIVSLNFQIPIMTMVLKYKHPVRL